MNVQLFAPRSKAEIEKLPKGRLKITNGTLPNKPVGALWTSTWNGRGSDWTEWVEYNMEKWKTSKGILIQVQSSAEIYSISNSKDYEKLYDTYGIQKDSYFWRKETPSALAKGRNSDHSLILHQSTLIVNVFFDCIRRCFSDRANEITI
jgi:hypothetical protein